MQTAPQSEDKLKISFSPSSPGPSRATPKVTCIPARRRILLLETDDLHARALGRVLRSVSGKVEVRRALAEVNPEEWDLLLVSYDALSEGERARLADLSQQKRGRLVVYSSDPNRRDLAELLGRQNLTNFLTRHGEVDPEDLLTTVQKILRRDIFGLEKYFSWAAQPFSAALRRSSEREAIWDMATTFGSRLGLPSRMRNLLCTVADELCTNAFYHAPTDLRGQPKFANLPRTMEISLAPREEIQVTFLCDGRRIGISVTDPFGTLSVETVRSYLARSFRQREDLLQERSDRSGLGLYYAFESLSHLVINLQPGQRTEVIGLLDIRGTYKDLASRGKSLNIFVTD